VFVFAGALLPRDDHQGMTTRGLLTTIGNIAAKPFVANVVSAGRHSITCGELQPYTTTRVEAMQPTCQIWSGWPRSFYWTIESVLRILRHWGVAARVRLRDLRQHTWLRPWRRWP